MVLGKISVPRRPTSLNNSRARVGRKKTQKLTRLSPRFCPRQGLLRLPSCFSQTERSTSLCNVETETATRRR